MLNNQNPNKTVEFNGTSYFMENICLKDADIQIKDILISEDGEYWIEQQQILNILKINIKSLKDNINQRIKDKNINENDVQLIPKNTIKGIRKKVHLSSNAFRQISYRSRSDLAIDKFNVLDFYIKNTLNSITSQNIPFNTKKIFLNKSKMNLKKHKDGKKEINNIPKSERIVISKIDKLDNVLHYKEQPFSSEYIVFGKKYKYTPDLIVTLKNNKKIVIEIKKNKKEILDPLTRLKKIWFRKVYNIQFVFIIYEKIYEEGYLKKLIK